MKFLKSHWQKLALVAILIIAVVGILLPQSDVVQPKPKMGALAEGDPMYYGDPTGRTATYVIAASDYTGSPQYDVKLTGTADNVISQAYLNLLPSTGGKIVFIGKTFTFAATVSRSINNVTIEAEGLNSIFSYNDTNALFSAGAQTGWSFQNMATDAGGITTAADTTFINVKINTGLYLVATNKIPPAGGGSGDMLKATYDTDSDGKVNSAVIADSATNQSGGTVNATEVKDDDLTSGRVVIAGASGILADDADLTFSGDTLTATKITTSNVTPGYIPVAGVGGLIQNAQSYQGRQYQIFNPYVSKTNVYKGEVHVHTTNSDGSGTPTETLEAYKAAGYNFISMCDHDVLTADPVVADIINIPGVEETPTDTYPHILNVGGSANASVASPQSIIDAIVAQRGLAIIAHPEAILDVMPVEFNMVVSTEELMQLTDFNGMEIRNGGVDDVGDVAREVKWGALLTAGKPIWAYTNDDVHNLAGLAFDKFNLKVFADSLTISNIVASLRNGNFYCQSKNGPALTISVVNNVITIGSDMAAGFTWIGKKGVTLQTNANTTSTSYTVLGDEKYVRCRVVKHGSTETAWTQPIIINSLGFGFESSSLLSSSKSTGLARAILNASILLPAGKPVRLEIDSVTNVTFDLGTNFRYGDWYGTAAAYRQADADSDSLHIQDDDAAFPAWIHGAYVKWSSAANGVANAGTGVIDWVSGTEVHIWKISGDDFAASYYYYVKESHYRVPENGYYRITGLALFATNVEADKIYNAFVCINGTFTVKGQQNQVHSSVGLSIRNQVSVIAHLVRGEMITITVQNLTGTTLTTNFATAGASRNDTSCIEIECIQRD
jgi:hypothetical protein